MAETAGLRAAGWARAGRVSRRALAALAMLLVAAATAAAADVALLVEDNKILQQIAQSFSASFKGSVEAVTLDAKAPDPALAKVRAASPKLVVALGSSAAKEARDKLGGTPLLYGGVLNPKKLGLESGSVGGTPMTPPIDRQWGIALKGLKGKRFGVLLSADNADKKAEAAEAAAKLGAKALVVEVGDAGLSEALKALEGEVDNVWVPLDPAVANQVAFKAIVDFCLKRKLALIVPAASYVKQGGLLSVSMSYAEMGRQLAEQAKAVLGGAAPRSAGKGGNADEITVSLAVASAVGVTFPADFLRAVTAKVE